MFDTKKFGAYIARKRKNLDMTQAEFAEVLSLTRQAISKYEVGDSFPDISILIKMADFFKITLDELILSANPTIGETEIIKNASAIEADSIAADDLINLAPHIKPSVIDRFADVLLSHGIDISNLVSIAQYLNDTNIRALLLETNQDAISADIVKGIIPFLDDKAKEIIVNKIIENEIDWKVIESILPYIESQTRLIEAAVIDGALPQEAIEIINNYFIEKQR